MEIEFSEGTIRFSRNLSELDKFVIDFVKMLNSLQIRYMIISGYISILFGRSRTTEDIDFFIEDIEKSKFDTFIDRIESSGLWIINTSDSNLAYRMLKDGDSIRIAKRRMAIPNMEIKVKSDKEIWQESTKIIVNDFEINTSRIENQIAFKFYLGSENDIEDAVYLYELLGDMLDKELLIKKCAGLGVLNEARRYIRE